MKPKPSKTVGTQTIHFVADHLTRSDHQLREIRPSSSPCVHIHRDGVSDSYQFRQGTSDQTNEDIGDSQNGFSENLCISQRFPVPLDTIKILSQAEIFSFAAFKSLQSENMDSKVLFEILKSMSRSITDAMSIVTAQTLGLQQLRHEAAIESAPKGFLTDKAKRKLRLSSFTSKLLFDGQVSTIYKENMTENQETLIRNAVSYSAKPNPSSSSSKKPKAKSGKKKFKPQETP